MCSHLCAHVCRSPVCGGERLTSNVFLDHSQPPILRQGLWLKLWLDSAILSSQLALGFPCLLCWVLGSKVKHPACLASKWMLWIWCLSLTLVWQGFFHWAVSPAAVFLLLMSTDLPSLSISILEKTLWTAFVWPGCTHNAVARSSLFAPFICWPRLPVRVGPLFCDVLSHWGCSVCRQRTVIFSPSRLFPSQCSRHLQRSCYSPQASLLSAHGRKSKQVVWKKTHEEEEHIRPPCVCSVNVRWVGLGPKPPSILKLKK